MPDAYHKQNKPKNTKKQDTTPAHDIPEGDVQQVLARYPEVAQALRQNTNPDELPTVLEPIVSLPEEVQVAFLKALAKEKTVEAADVAQALNTLTDQKEVRKEARRTLIKLETAKIYPEWTPPRAPTLSQLLDMTQADGEDEDEGDEDEDFDEQDMATTPGSSLDSSILSDFESFLSSASGLFGRPEYEETVSAFLESWTDGDYEDAYSYLASSSPLREGLSEDEWVARRQQWEAETHPTGLRTSFSISLTADEENEDEDADTVVESQQPGLQVGWSLAFAETPTAPKLPELPEATIAFKGTGRHWFWSTYTVVEEDGEWLIQDMIDEGAKILRLPANEIQQRLSDLTAAISNYIEQEGLDDLDEGDEDDEEMSAETLDTGEIEVEDDEDDDFDEDDEDFEDDEEEDFVKALHYLDDAIRMSTQAMHYNDALIAQAPGSDPAPYQISANLAMTTNDPERSAVYSQLIAEHFPDLRGKALRDLGSAYLQISDNYAKEEEEEQAERFTTLAEEALRTSIAIDASSPYGFMLLAQLLIKGEEQLDEAETLLNQAKPLITDLQDTVVLEEDFAEIAMIRENLPVALKHLQRVAELEPEEAVTWFEIGSIQAQLEQYAEAERSLRRSIELDPEEVGAYSELANVYVMQRNTTRARDILKQGLEYNPDSAELLSLLSLVYMQSGDLRSAQKYLEQAEDTDEDLEIVQQTRALFEAQKSQRNPPKSKHTKHHKPKKR